MTPWLSRPSTSLRDPTRPSTSRSRELCWRMLREKTSITSSHRWPQRLKRLCTSRFSTGETTTTNSRPLSRHSRYHSGLPSRPTPGDGTSPPPQRVRCKMRFAIVDYGVGNLFSLRTALQREGVETFLAKGKRGLSDADALVLPGVGGFHAAAKGLPHEELRELGLLCPLLLPRYEGRLGSCHHPVRCRISRHNRAEEYRRDSVSP